MSMVEVVIASTINSSFPMNEMTDTGTVYSSVPKVKLVITGTIYSRYSHDGGGQYWYYMQ